MKFVEFDINSTFDSLKSGDAGLRFEMATHVGKASYDLNGPQQPSMTPTETVQLGYEKQTSPTDKDPSWNT